MTSNSLKKPSKSLPFDWYHNSRIYNKEIETIFNEEWLYVCHVNTIQSKHYRTLQVDNKNIVIIKNKNNEISVFFNTCMHRGSQIFTEEQGKLHSPVIVCPYHQWSYKSDNGELINTTSIKYNSFDNKKYNLKKVNYYVWKGLIFINFKNNKKFKLKSVFQYYDTAIEKVNLENFVSGHIWKKTVQCNWKIYWENYSECLHCPNIHPELSELVPLYKRRLVDIKDHPEWNVLKENNQSEMYHGGLKKGSETWSYNGSAQGHMMKELKSDLETRGQIFISTWPSMFLGIYGDHIRIVRLISKGPEQMELTVEWLFDENTLKDPKYDKTNVVDFAILVMEQDASISEVNQRGLYNLQNSEGVLMPEEYMIRDFQKYIRSKVK
jgi:Rieske 2Fe-2S family protein